MQMIRCEACGSNELIKNGAYYVCKYCGTRFFDEKDASGVESNIDLVSDVDNLLQKCRLDPKNAKRYANLILDIDPDNKDALKYL